MLQYALRMNALDSEESNFIAQVTNTRSYSLNEIIDLMIQRGSSLTKADMTAVLQVYGEVVSSLLQDGCAINTPLFNSSFSISGVFKGASDSFDATRHTVHVQMNAGTLLRERMSKIKIEKIESLPLNPNIIEVSDVLSGSMNRIITRGGILRIVGNRLKFDTADAEQGVFLVSDTNAQLRCSIVAENKPRSIMVMAPSDMDGGTYYVEVRSRLLNSSKERKVIKTGRFGKALMVEEA